MNTADLYDRLLDVATEYLLSLGIDLAVIGGITIEHTPLARMHNHKLTVGFTATLPDYLPDHAPEVTG